MVKLQLVKTEWVGTIVAEGIDIDRYEEMIPGAVDVIVTPVEIRTEVTYTVELTGDTVTDEMLDSVADAFDVGVDVITVLE